MNEWFEYSYKWSIQSRPFSLVFKATYNFFLSYLFNFSSYCFSTGYNIILIFIAVLSSYFFYLKCPLYFFSEFYLLCSTFSVKLRQTWMCIMCALTVFLIYVYYLTLIIFELKSFLWVLSMAKVRDYVIYLFCIYAAERSGSWTSEEEIRGNIDEKNRGVEIVVRKTWEHSWNIGLF